MSFPGVLSGSTQKYPTRSNWKRSYGFEFAIDLSTSTL
ncbi:unnamed protein product [Haemonchus placei]|uniref:Uncharacterized protein n=1 Tax=Haemonchus placei TaxID=6290 RepID=A0A158QNV7_HAEPC|nr:unnamed protein product [Haemonchus placei]